MQVTKSQINKIATHPLQTREWGEFRKKWGNELLYTKYGLITVHRLPFTNHRVGMFIKGPKPTVKMLLDLTKIAKENNLIFIRIEPNTLKSDFQLSIFKNFNIIPGKTLFTPTSFWIDLGKSENDLLKSFSSKTRYNIHLAQRKGVKVRIDNSDKAFKKYLSLMRQTVARQGFYAHNQRYHQLMWKYLHKKPLAINQQPLAHLLTASYKGEIITAWIVFVWKDFLYYPYGASSSSPEYNRLMPNNLIMWEAIRFGKKLGLRTFDLWGREEGKGFSRFKQGYNPKVVEFLGTWDLVINKPMYYIYRLAEILRWPILRAKSRLQKPHF